MKILELISLTALGLIALVIFIIAMLADGLAWIFDYIGEQCKNAATWLIEV